MSTLTLNQSLLIPRSGRIAFLYSGPAELLNSDISVDGTLDAETLTPTDDLSGVLSITSTFTETITFSEVLSGDYLIQITDTLTPTDSLTTPDQSAAALVETLSFTDTLESPDISTTLTESLDFNDTLSGNLQITSQFADTLYPADSLSAAFTSTFTETLSLTDSLGADYAPVSFEETFTTTDSLSGTLSVSSLFIETLSLTDALDSIAFMDFVETLSPSDILTGTAYFGSAFTDSLTPTDSLSGSVLLYGELTDSLSVSDVLSGSLNLFGEFTETLTPNDVLVVTQNQKILVVNAETGAVSEYRFNSIIQGIGAWQGKLYLTTSSGLYALDAATDDGSVIEWVFRTGFSNLGTDALKRILDANVLARGSGNMSLILVTDQYGEKEEHHYQRALGSTSLREQVIKAGQGLASVYWQVGCQGEGPAEIDQLRLRIGSLNRRR